MQISTGTPEDHPNVLPIDTSATPRVAPVTQTAGSGTGQGGVMDATAMFAGQQRQGEADVAAAMSAGMTAESDRRGHFAADILPQGAAYGDAMDLPPVDSAAHPPLWGPYGSDQPPSGTFT